MKLETIYTSKDEYGVVYESDPLCISILDSEDDNPRFEPISIRITAYGNADLVRQRMDEIGIDIFLKGAFDSAIMYDKNKTYQDDLISSLDKFFKLYTVTDASMHGISKIIKIAVQNKLDGLKADSDESIEVRDVLIK